MGLSKEHRDGTMPRQGRQGIALDPLTRAVRPSFPSPAAALPQNLFPRTRQGSAEGRSPFAGGTGVSPVIGFITPFLAEPALSLSKGRGAGG